MKIDLSQEYKDNLYEKVLEKKKQRTKTRKVLLNTFLVFVSVVGIASYGFSKLSKGDYNNFFISKTDNIEFNDEYEYFDDLGIKLEFINKDENSLTLGINIKYENIKDYEVEFEDIRLYEKKDENDKEEYIFVNSLNKYRENKSASEMVYILEYKFIDNIDKKYIVSLNNINILKIDNDKIDSINMNWEKEISIE